MAKTKITVSKSRMALAVFFIVFWGAASYFMLEAEVGVPIVVLVGFFGLIVSFCSVCWWMDRKRKDDNADAAA